MHVRHIECPTKKVPPGLLVIRTSCFAFIIIIILIIHFVGTTFKDVPASRN